MALGRRRVREDSIGSLGDMEYLASSGLWVPVSGSRATGKVPVVQSDGTIAWEAQAAGVSPSVWNPDAPPSSPSSIDDEYDAGSLGGSYTTRGTGLTATQAGSKLQLSATATGAAANVRAVDVAIPVALNSAYSVITHMYLLSSSTFSVGQLSVRNAATGKFSNCNFFQNNATNQFDTWVGYSRYSALTTRAATAGEIAIYRRDLFLRISSDGTTLTFSWSPNGVDYLTITTETLATNFGASLPDRVGIGLDTWSATVAGRISCEFLRFYSTANAITGRLTSG